MNKMIAYFGNGVGLAGVVLTIAAGIGRATGHYYFAGFEILTLFSGGVGLMVMACLAKLQLLASGRG